MNIHQILFYTQIIISIALIVMIAMQQRGTGLGAGFGGGGEFYSQRRGIQKTLYYATILVAGLFLLLGILGLITK